MSHRAARPGIPLVSPKRSWGAVQTKAPHISIDTNPPAVQGRDFYCNRDSARNRRTTQASDKSCDLEAAEKTWRLFRAGCGGAARARSAIRQAPPASRVRPPNLCIRQTRRDQLQPCALREPSISLDSAEDPSIANLRKLILFAAPMAPFLADELQIPPHCTSDARALRALADNSASPPWPAITANRTTVR